MEELSYEEFYEQVWDYVSGKIVSDQFYFENEGMMRAITKDLYDMSCLEECNMHPKYYGRLVESFFYNLFEHKSNSSPEDPNQINFEYDRIQL